MSQKMTFQRNLIGMQDLLLGVGDVTQTRGVTQVPLSKINAAEFPYDETLTLKEKVDSLVTNHYVDAANLPVYVATPSSGTALNLPSVIWIKEISASEAEVYFYTTLMFKFNPTAGDLILAAASFASAEAEITAAYTAADIVIRDYVLAQLNAFITVQETANTTMEAAWKEADAESIASLSLGTASTKDAGTSPLNIVQLTAESKLPAVDGSNLTNLPAATLPSGAIVKKTITTATTATAFSSLVPRAGSAPASSVGTELLTKTVTPTAIGNTIIVKFRGSAHASAVGVMAAALIFKDSTFVAGSYSGSANGGPLYPSEVSVEYSFVTTSLTAIVFSVRVGPTVTAGEIRWDDNSWGSTGKNVSLIIEEIKA